MTLNISLESEQSQRLENDAAAIETQIDFESDFYYDGQFVGSTGGEPDPEQWSQIAYRSGYLIGVGEFYDRKYQTVFKEDTF